MKDNDLIEITDGIGVCEQRQLMEITKTMARALTNDEFIKIISIYNDAIERVLSKQGGEECNHSWIYAEHISPATLNFYCRDCSETKVISANYIFSNEEKLRIINEVTGGD